MDPYKTSCFDDGGNRANAKAERIARKEAAIVALLAAARARAAKGLSASKHKDIEPTCMSRVSQRDRAIWWLLRQIPLTWIDEAHLMMLWNTLGHQTLRTLQVIGSRVVLMTGTPM